MTRSELQEETGIARATLGRILSDLQDRGWIRQDGQYYEATPEAAHLVEEFEALLDIGFSVSVDGDTALVGAVAEDPDDTSDAGSAYVF